MSSSFPLTTSFRLRVSGDTHCGRVRDHNEDSIYLPTQEPLVLVADGMGGHAGGEVASQIAVETVATFFEDSAEECDRTWPFRIDPENQRHQSRLISAFKLANFRIHEAAQQRQRERGMGTTLVALYFRDREAIWAHVGDSRIYRIRAGSIVQLTEDHSLLNDYIRMNRLSPQEAEDFPHKNVIVRALGMTDVVAVDLQCEELRVGDIFVLCSDGLSGMISDEGILKRVEAEPDLDRAVELLIEDANQAGGKDNITAALARIESP